MVSSCLNTKRLVESGFWAVYLRASVFFFVYIIAVRQAEDLDEDGKARMELNKNVKICLIFKMEPL